MWTTPALAVDAVLDVLLPDSCPGCEAPRGAGPGGLCPDCALQVPGRLRPFDGPEPVAWAFGLGPYDGPLGAMVRRAKYRPDPYTCRRLAEWLAAASAARLPQVQAVCSVPVPDARRMRRGFDQAELLARQVAVAVGAPYRPLLRRLRSAEQAGRSHRERRVGARGAFGLVAAPPERVLLVDDVVTTGATAAACADALLLGGGRRVGLLCVAAACL